MGGEGFVTSSVQYAAQPTEPLWFNADDRTHNIKYLDCIVRLHDARPLIGCTSIDREGFEIHQLDSRVSDWDDEDEVKRVYYQEASEFVMRITGSKYAMVFDHTFRRVDEAYSSQDKVGSARTSAASAGTSDEPAETIAASAEKSTAQTADCTKAKRRPSARGPAKGVHNDFTAASAPKRLNELFGVADLSKKVGRFAIVNVWKPIVDVVLDVPLGVLDATTVLPQDLTSYDLIFPNRIGQTLTAHWSPERHKWYYLPKQRSGEVLIFKQFDTDTTKTQFTPHSPFRDPNAPAPGSFKQRESLELRIFVFFNASKEEVESLTQCNSLSREPR